MARSFAVPVGLFASASDPASGNAGDTYFNTIQNAVKTYDGTKWISAISIEHLDGGHPNSVYGGNGSYDAGTVG